MSDGEYVPGYDYVPEGWARATPYMTGWSIPQRAREYADACLRLMKQVNGTAPLGENIVQHNTYMSYAYALTLGAKNRTKVSILDYGGAVGMYAVLSRLILPRDIQIDYHCRDVPAYAEYAKKLLPWITFHTGDSTIQGMKFDIVLASGVVQCVEKWQELISLLSTLTGDLLFVTRLSIVASGDSFVISQKLPQFVNETLLWCLDRDRFIREGTGNGMLLLREFLLENNFEIRNAPAAVQYRGFLFQARQSLDAARHIA